MIPNKNYEINLHPEFETLPEETKQLKVVNRLNDVLFKYVFGRNENKNILINFLNSVLEPEGKQIIDLEYLDRESSPKIQGGKGCRFDVRAKAADGRIFHVEVQAGEDENFFERCLFYACESYAGQLKAGGFYSELMPLILIGVLGYEEFDGDEVHSRFMFMETERHKIGTNAFEFHFFELPKFKNSADVSGRKFYRWLRYLSSNNKDKELEGDEMIGEALRAEERFLSNPESRFRYMQAEYEKYASAKREAFFISKGEARGRAEAVRCMAQAHMPASQISSIIGMSVQEVSDILSSGTQP